LQRPFRRAAPPLSPRWYRYGAVRCAVGSLRCLALPVIVDLMRCLPAGVCFPHGLGPPVSRDGSSAAARGQIYKNESLARVRV
jgi:hypothetical protein